MLWPRMEFCDVSVNDCWRYAAAGANQAMDSFQRPSLREQFIGQPIEQLRMRGMAATESEVAGCFHQPGTKVVVPQPIHDDSASQRIRRRGDPIGECFATVTVGRLRRAEFRLQTNNT